MDDQKILDELLKRGLRAILLKSRSKLPTPHPETGGHWYTVNPAVVNQHLKRGGNVGIVGHNVAVLDFDIEQGRIDMVKALGALQPTVRTGSGKLHYYVSPDKTLPGKIRWNGVVIGDIRRSSTEYVVAPPSFHPNGERYTFVNHPTLAPIPEKWLVALRAQPAGDGVGAEFELPEIIQEGERHRVLYQWIRSMKARGYTDIEAFGVIRAANYGVESPPAWMGFTPTTLVQPPIPLKELRPWFTRAWNQPNREGFNEGEIVEAVRQQRPAATLSRKPEAVAKTR